MATKQITPNPNDNNKQLYAVINTLLIKIEDHEKRIKILEATTSNDIKPGITSD